ncbi:MAG TPA: HAMP domain-containing sensor histidine kinase [Candidatus Dormibacteraeota bacterium]|nr:HAMP domain-containing sensor histidine kinase [Candidatus Dormibacteraeota bacterium]
MKTKTSRLEPVTVRLAPTPDGDHGEAVAHLASLEHLNRMIAGFASMVSHETRSALVGIQGWSELIRDGGLSDEEIRRAASDIFDGAQRIDRMIGQMFDLNRLETRQVALPRRKIDLNAIANDVVANQLVRQPVPPIALQLDPAIPPIAGDPDRLAQALDNFVTFARAKATAKSKVSITSELVDRRIRMGVRSDSMRAPSFDDWLFGRYERYEKRPSSIMGAGLGLAISRVIVELHDGRVSIERYPDGSAELNLFLPVSGEVLKPSPVA